MTDIDLVACKRCGETVWVGESGLLYSLLGESCEK
jgi:hypothetical protein